MAWNFIDLTGQTFGKWLVMSFNKDTHKWICKCECGTIKEITGTRLRSGRTKSCGCNRHKSHGDTTSLIGKKYNNLTVVAFDHFDKRKKDYWKCKCDCGNETIVQGYNLKSGKVKSCGCAYKDCNFEDISGSKFGMLTVDHFIERRNGQSYYECICECGNHIEANANNLKRGHYYSCGCASRSSEESDVLDFVKTFNIPVETNVRILDGKEIDIYIPSKNLGIEYNGSVYHATINSLYTNKDKNYHRYKFLYAKEKGIHLVTIFDVDWQNKQDKIKAYLKDLLISPKKVFARKCTLKKIDKKTANDFCDAYHLQGGTNLSSIDYGIFLNGELLSVMTFGKLRLKKQIAGHYELHRYCVKSGYTIIGGANRLFKAFLKEYKPVNVLSYSDNDYFDGAIYPRLGFKFVKQVEQPYYWYLKGEELKRESCQAHKLKLKYPNLYEDATKLGKGIENYVMESLGARKVYRCGNTRWEFDSHANV